MLSGRQFDLVDPPPMEIEVEDVAHPLAFVAHGKGQTPGKHPFSFAEHLLAVEEHFERLVPELIARWRLTALLHEAPELVIGDMISSAKVVIGRACDALDARLLLGVACQSYNVLTDIA